MRLRDILNEDYSENLDSDLTNLLLNAKSMGHDELKTSDLVRQLRSMGYSSVDMNSIQSLLQNSPAVMSSNDGSISLNAQSPETDSGEDSAAKVKQLANKASGL